MASTWIYLVLTILCLHQVRSQVCTDLDANACALLQKAQPTFCSTSPLAQSACQRFCGNCPLTCYDCPQHSVLNSSACTTTRACSIDETCMINTLLAHDGHVEHIMTCGEKKYCNGFGFGFTGVGKRSLGYRDLSLKCCHTDLCNIPDFTTTAVPVVMSTTTLPPLQSCHSDIVFMIDESGSIGPTAFHKILTFVKNVVSRLDIGTHSDLVALLVYDNTPHPEWNLNEYTSKAELLGALTYVPFHDGTTRTDLALKFVRENMLTFQNGDRPSAKDVVIVMTDGRSTAHANTVAEAQRLHTPGNVVVALGVGYQANSKELLDIASDQNHAIRVSTYDHLTDAIPYLMKSIC